MGTSGAYGGSPGWNGIQEATTDWLDSDLPQGGEGGGVDESGAGPPDSEQLPEHQNEDFPTSPLGQMNPRIAKILGGVTAKLTQRISQPSAAPSRPGTTSRDRGRTTNGERGGRSRAAVVGGTAISAVHGLRAGERGALADIGLALADLDGRSPVEQSRLIIDTALGGYLPIEGDELRVVSATFVWHCLELDTPLSPSELVKSWVTEFVYQAWLTEAGKVLRDGSRDGASTRALESEVRATLEAAIERVEVPVKEVTSSGFQQVIKDALGMLNRIFADLSL